MIFSKRRKPVATVFFVTDIHGSDICFKKFVNARKHYQADILILGGDMTGKTIVPIMAKGNGRFLGYFMGAEEDLEDEEQMKVFCHRVSDMGYYPHKTNEDELSELRQDKSLLEKLFRQKMFERLEEWIAYANRILEGEQILVAPGNDDPHDIDEMIQESNVMELVEGRSIQLPSGHWIASSGWSNPTPWDTHREEDESLLETRIRSIIEEIPSMERCIFNLHAPPYQSNLDTGPDLEEDWSQKTSIGAPLMKPVGSTAVRNLVKEFQPMLGLFGHIHEARGSTRIGRTLCINPGSEYAEGILRGCLIMLEDSDKVQTYQFTAG